VAYPLPSCLLQRGVILRFGLSRDWWPGRYPVDAFGLRFLRSGPLIFPLSCDELQRIQKNENGYNDRHVVRPSILASCTGSSDYAYCDGSYIFNGDGLDQSPGFRGGMQFRSKCRLSCSTAQRCACVLARPRSVGVCSRWCLAHQAAAWGPSRIPVSRHTCFSVGVPPVIHGTHRQVDWRSGLASELGAGGTCSPTRSGRVPVLTSSG